MPLQNGLHPIDEGTPGVPRTGDQLADIADKLNRNFQIILTQHDQLAGDGLNQTGRRLELDVFNAEVVEVDLAQQGSVDLSTIPAGSALHLTNGSGSAQTLTLNGLSDVAELTTFWVAFTGDNSVTLRLNGGLFLSEYWNPEGNGEIMVSNPTSLQMRKLDKKYWMVI